VSKRPPSLLRGDPKIHCQYACTGDEEAYLRNNFGVGSFGQVRHSHAVAAYERSVVEAEAYQLVRDMTPDRQAAVILDWGGSLQRHDLAMREVHCCCPLLDNADAFRESKRLAHVKGPTYRHVGAYCNHAAQDCRCVPKVRASMSVHVLYYMTADQIAQAMAYQEHTLHVGVVHLFNGVNGSILAGTAEWARTSAYTSRVTMHFRGHQSVSNYTHSSMDWLALGSTATPYGILAWSVDRIRGSSAIVVFTLGVLQQTTAVAASTGLARIDTDAHEIDVRSLNFPAPMHAHHTATYALPRVYRIFRDFYVETGVDTVRLPSEVVAKVGALHAFNKVTPEAIHAVKNSCLRELQNVNMTPEEREAALLVMVPLILVRNLTAVERNLFVTVGRNLGQLARYHKALELKFPQVVVPLKVLLWAMWLSFAVSWWSTTAVKHWPWFWAVLPILLLLLPGVALLPWHWLWFKYKQYQYSQFVYKRRCKVRLLQGQVPEMQPISAGGYTHVGADGTMENRGRLKLPEAATQATTARPAYSTVVEIADVQPTVFESGNTENEAAALTLRLLSSDTTRDDIAEAWDGVDFFLESKDLNRHIYGPKPYPQLAPVPLEVWESKFTQDRREVIRRDHAKWWTAEAAAMSRLAEDVDVFVKAEHGFKNKPRGIVNVRPAFHQVVGPWTQAFQQHLQQLWNGTNWITLASGMSEEDLGAWMVFQTARLTVGGTPPLACGGDANSYEGSIAVAALKHRYKLYKAHGMPELQADAYAEAISWRATTKGRVRVTKTGTAASGKDDTLVGNSISTGVSHIAALATYIDNLPAHVALLLQGDDVYILMDCLLAERLDWKMDKVKADVARLGFDFDYSKLEQSSYERPSRTDFCSGYFYWFADGTCRWGMKPFRALSKIYQPFFDTRNPDPLKQAKGVALGLRHSAQHLPVFRTVTNKLCRDNVIGWVHKTPWSEHKFRATRSRDADLDFCDRLYGLSPGTMLTLESTLSVQEGWPMVVQSDLVKECFLLDNPIKPNNLLAVIDESTPNLALNDVNNFNAEFDLWRRTDTMLDQHPALLVRMDPPIGAPVG